MYLADKIRPVVHRDYRLVIERGVDVPVVDIRRLTANRIHRNFVTCDQRSRHVILRAEWITGTQDNIGARRFKGSGQVGGFSRNMKTATQTNTVQGTLLAETVREPA
jgi:hypothetical protein